MSFWKKLFGVKESSKADIAGAESTQPTVLQLILEEPHRVAREQSASILEAARKGDLARVKSLLWRNPELVSTKGSNSPCWTPLHWAVTVGYKDVAELLLVNGAPVNAKDFSGGTPLHIAGRRGDKILVELLVVYKADVNAKDNHGSTPLHEATYNNRFDVVKSLLANKAEVNAMDNEGWTPLYYAARYGHWGLENLLREHGGH